MKRLSWVVKYLTFILAIAANSYASSFEKADANFSRREEGASFIVEARREYISLVGTISKDELIYALEQIAKLDIYSALSITEDSISKRKPILENCVRDLQHINPEKPSVGENPAYYYWSSICRSYLSEAIGGIEPLRQSSELFEMAKHGKSLNARYEGGGFDRVLGTLYLKIPATNPFGTAGNIQLAINHLRKSLESEADERSNQPEYDRGIYHYATHYYYAQALWEAAHYKEAKELIKATIENIESGDLPTGREAESRLALQWLKDLSRRWGL